ncbi:phosphatidylinositol 3-kinase C2 domain-containing subunit gamma-like isoform X2 [Heptranchias perlo]|uniref:phosphatidylinositol 3-kinase C2 domain-containing subunit gamma-like isoform X2 n=1 Tax=Heptranchias perlo TaxID=212740 RepID=UPI003559E276
MEDWRMELPVGGSSPGHQQYPAPDPSAQPPYGWQVNCTELEIGTATIDLQRMPSSVHFQGTIPTVNPMNPLPNYQIPYSTCMQTFSDCQLQHNEPVMGIPRVDSCRPTLLNQETVASVGIQNVYYTKLPEENYYDWHLASNQMAFDQDLFSFQKKPEVEFAKEIVPGNLQESGSAQTSHTEPVPYPINPEQMFYEYPFDSGPKMPTPASDSLEKESSLMNMGWSLYDQPVTPSTTESCQIPPDLHPKMMHLNSDPKCLGAGYQEVSSLQFQDVCPASTHSPRPSHPTFEMNLSKGSEHQKPTEAAVDQFMQSGMAEMDSNSSQSPLVPIGFEAMGPSHTNLSNQYSSGAPFQLPNIFKTDTTLNQQSQLLPPASSTNCCSPPDVWMKVSASDLPVSGRVFSFQPSKDNFSATFDPRESKGLSLPLADQQVKLVDKPEGSNEEVAVFCNLLNMLRAKYPSSETQSNCGLIRSIVTVFPDELLWVWRIPVTIVTDIFPESVQTFPHAGSTVEELIHEILYDTRQNSEARNYVLKLCDAEEVLLNPCTLGSHECLQHYLKLNNDIRLQLLRHSDLQRVLARTVGDDQGPSTLQQSVAIENGACKVSLSRKALNSKLDSYHHEASSLLSTQKSTCRVVEEVKAICYMLSSVETKEITAAIQQLKSVDSQQQQTSFHSVQLPNRQGSRAGAISALTAAVSQLIHIYCNNFDTDYQAANVSATETTSVAQAQLNTERLNFNIYAVHGIPSAWARSYENLFVSCSLNYGGKELCQWVKTEEISITKSSLFLLARWNHRMYMPIEIKQLPCEATLNLAFHGYRTTTGNYSDANKHSKNAETLARASMPLYSSKLVLVHSTKLLCLVPANTSQTDSLILQIDFPASLLVTFSRPAPAMYNQHFTDIDEVSRKQITSIQQKHSLLLVEEEEKNLLWTKRSFCNSSNCFLPLLLGSAPSWESGSLPEIYAVLRRWSFSANPLESLGLLLSSFSDQELRQAAVQQLGTILDDELLDYLPQLVQAIKFEWHLNSPLVEFLLDRSMRSIRVAHQLYWLLKDGLADSQFKGRYSQLLAAVLCCSGHAIREEFDKETKLIDRLAEVAEKVWTADQSKRSTVLMKEIEEVEKFFYQEHVCRLPLNPAFAVKGIDASACSYFTSNAVPLKISFINADPLGKNINVIYKSGDDLRQDMLVLQIIKVMDRVWCQEGLNMSMIIYRCTSTGRGRGLVEMVPGATTLAKIHMKHGIIGPLMENTLSKWFQEHNPTEELHKNAVENFVNSCAGWCVATFILGICDRHNDNIMLKTTGHMFHIDFGKFLGHAQMIGSMKRDRAPFIFTSEMEHFITEGGKNGAHFQRFVDLSCLAYNIIRQHTQLLMNLLELMLSAGLPELAEVQDLKYVYNNLRPKDSDAQATSYFTSLIKESLRSLPVKINFVAHIVAQMKFADPDVQPSLSFAPGKYTLQTDGLIRSAFVCGYEKKIVPHKEYFYKLQVERQGQSEATFIERSFNQFGELNKQLHCCFPASELPRFPYKPLIGLSKGRELARKRKDELNVYLRYLLNGSSHVAMSDLVYTFFHCFPNNERPSVSSSPEAVSHTGKLSASTQLCISWENSKLSVMVKHVKNIFLPDGSAPDAYVKIYVLPDAERMTKRKTKVVPKNSNPTYNQILEYVGISSTELPNRVIQLSVCCRQTLLGAVNIPLRNVKLDEEKWYRLGNSLV